MKLYNGLCIGGPMDGHIQSADSISFSIPLSPKHPIPVVQRAGRIAVAFDVMEYRHFPGIKVYQRDVIKSYDFWVPAKSEITINQILETLISTYAETKTMKVPS